MITNLPNNNSAPSPTAKGSVARNNLATHPTVTNKKSQNNGNPDAKANNAFGVLLARQMEETAAVLPEMTSASNQAPYTTMAGKTTTTTISIDNSSPPQVIDPTSIALTALLFANQEKRPASGNSSEITVTANSASENANTGNLGAGNMSTENSYASTLLGADPVVKSTVTEKTGAGKIIIGNRQTGTQTKGIANSNISSTESSIISNIPNPATGNAISNKTNAENTITDKSNMQSDLSGKPVTQSTPVRTDKLVTDNPITSNQTDANKPITGNHIPTTRSAKMTDAESTRDPISGKPVVDSTGNKAAATQPVFDNHIPDTQATKTTDAAIIRNPLAANPVIENTIAANKSSIAQPVSDNRVPDTQAATTTDTGNIRNPLSANPVIENTIAANKTGVAQPVSDNRVPDAQAATTTDTGNIHNPLAGNSTIENTIAANKTGVAQPVSDTRVQDTQAAEMTDTGTIRNPLSGNPVVDNTVANSKTENISNNNLTPAKSTSEGNILTNVKVMDDARNVSQETGVNQAINGEKISSSHSAPRVNANSEKPAISNPNVTNSPANLAEKQVLHSTESIDLAKNADLKSANGPSAQTQATATLTPSGLQLNTQANVPQSPQTINAQVGSRQWPEELSQKVIWVSSQQNHTAELHLNPPDLGPMRVVLSISDNQATAQFTSPHSAVREAIENALPKLRESLAENGIMLGDASVNDQAPRDNNAANFMMNQQNNARSQTNNTLFSTEAAPAPLPPAPERRQVGIIDTFA